MATSSVSSIPSNIFAGIMPPFVWTADRKREPFDEPVEIQQNCEPELHEALLAASAVAAPVTTPQVDPGAAREQVLLDHMPLVRFVARRIHERLPQHVELEDLVSAGMLGLIDAFNKFDTGKNVQFRSYAQFRVRGAILDSLRDLDWGSRELRRKGRSIEEAVQKLTQQYSRRPSESEIAVELGMRLSQYQDLLGDLKGLEIGSLQELRSEDSDEELAFLPTSPEQDPLFLCMKSQLSSQLVEAIQTLPEREARVLAMYYVQEMTLKEIGVVLGLVESRVSQIRAAAVMGLRTRMVRTKRPMEIVSRTASKVRKPLVPVAIMQASVSAGRTLNQARLAAR